MKTMGAAIAKAQFLALLDEVEAKREPVVLTKNGREVARMMPMPLVANDPVFGFYKGKLEIVGDVLSPVHDDAENDGFQRSSASQMRGKRR